METQEPTSLTDYAEELRASLTEKRPVTARTVFGGSDKSLRQTLIVMLGGGTLAEHESPGEATMTVLSGRVSLDAGEDSWIGRRGDFLAIPPVRHSVRAMADSAFLLSVAMT